MDLNSDVYPQWQQLRSTSCLKGIKYNNHKKCPNRGRYCFKGKSAHPNSAYSKPAFEYNLENFPRLDETKGVNKFANENNNNKNMGATHGSIRIKNGSCTSTPEIVSDELEYMDQVLPEANKSESEDNKKHNTGGRMHSMSQYSDHSNKQKENREICYNTSLLSSEPDETVSQCKKRGKKKTIKKISENTIKIIHDNNNNSNSKKKIEHEIKEQNRIANDDLWIINTEPIIDTVLRNSALYESSNTMLSPETIQDSVGFEVYKSKGHRMRHSSVSSDCARHSSGHRTRHYSVPSDRDRHSSGYRTRHSSGSSDRARHSSVSSDTSYASMLSIAEVPDNWELRDSTASPGDLQPKDIKLPTRSNDNSLISDDRSSEYQKNVLQEIISTPTLSDYMDIELPYKPKPVKLTDQEKENLKNIRPKTYKLYGFMTEEYSSETSNTMSISNICKNTVSNNSKNIFLQDGLETNKLVSSKKNEVNSSNRESESSIEKKIMKSSANNSINRNIQHLSHPIHFGYNKSSVEYSSNSHRIKRINLKNNEINKNETIGNDFLNHSSFLINNQKGPTKNLEDNSKNPSRRNSSEFGQRGYLAPSYHTWAPETFFRPNEWPRNLQSPDWMRKSFSPSSLSLDEDDYYFGNIPYDVDYHNGSDCESTPRSLMSPLDDYTSSHSSSDATTPSPLADMLDFRHSSTPCSWDPNKSNSPIANHILNEEFGFVHYTGISHTEGSPAKNSAMSPPMFGMFTQFQVPGATNLTSHPLPAVASSSQLLESSLSCVTHKNLNLYEESLLSSKNCSRQQNEKKSWFDPIMVKGNIWA